MKGAAILGSAITGFISYKISVKTDKLALLKRKLCTAYRDISSFYQLEIFYTEKIAQLEGDTPETVKRAFREKLRDEGFESPSRYSTPSHISEELRRYE
jgi:hypothetical protein